MRPFSIVLPLAFLVMAGCSPAGRTGAPSDAHMAGTDMAMAMHADSDSEATRGYKTSMTSMMAQMPAFTGNADIDFMKQMRGHHQAAIAMAEVEIANGADPEAKLLAQNIIRDQKAEIAQIDVWLEKQAK